MRAERAHPAIRVAPEPGSSAPGKSLRHLGTDDRSSQRVRIVDGALACIARQGVAKTTLDDIARASGLSRATVYRAFPGGKEAVLAAIVDTEVARFFSRLAVALGGARDIEDVLVAGILEAARQIRTHAALCTVLEHEPELISAHLAFDEMDRVLAVASGFTGPFLARWLEPEQALRAAEWAVRVVISYLGSPSPHLDLTQPADVTHLVCRFLLPGIQALRFTT